MATQQKDPGVGTNGKPERTPEEKSLSESIYTSVRIRLKKKLIFSSPRQKTSFVLSYRDSIVKFIEKNKKKRWSEVQFVHFGRILSNFTYILFVQRN